LLSVAVSRFTVLLGNKKMNEEKEK
jgi:hypothetical protein